MAPQTELPRWSLSQITDPKNLKTESPCPFRDSKRHMDALCFRTPPRWSIFCFAPAAWVVTSLFILKQVALTPEPHKSIEPREAVTSPFPPLKKEKRDQSVIETNNPLLFQTPSFQQGLLFRKCSSAKLGCQSAFILFLKKAGEMHGWAPNPDPEDRKLTMKAQCLRACAEFLSHS